MFPEATDEQKKTVDCTKTECAQGSRSKNKLKGVFSLSWKEKSNKKYFVAVPFFLFHFILLRFRSVPFCYILLYILE